MLRFIGRGLDRAGCIHKIQKEAELHARPVSETQNCLVKCSWCNKHFIVAHLNEDSNDRCLGEVTISLCIDDLVMQPWYVVALVRQKAALCGPMAS